jgi:hypothetical protein
MVGERMYNLGARWMEVSGQPHAPAASPLYPLIGGLVGPKAGLDAVANRKFPAPAGNETPVVQAVA